MNDYLYDLDAQYRKVVEKKEKDKKMFVIIMIITGVIAVLGLAKEIITIICIAFAVAIGIVYCIRNSAYNSKISQLYSQLYSDMESSILQTMGISSWKYNQNSPEKNIQLKSAQAVTKYDDIKFFKDNAGSFENAVAVMNDKKKYGDILSKFLSNNDYKNLILYPEFENIITNSIENTKAYRVYVSYTSPTGKSHSHNTLLITHKRLKELEQDKSLLMSKGEYSKYLKEQAKAELEEKHHSYYEMVNAIIDFANNNKEILIVKGDSDELDKLINLLFDRTVNSIKKIKSIDSEEWRMLDDYISNINEGVNKIVAKNRRILEYYDSEEFIKIKNTCDTLMNTQKEFNDYIDEKVKSISKLFGTNVVRNETVVEDEYNYIHPYKKSITPFTAEVSANVFASAENSPLEYIVKTFYPDKNRYPEQIQKLHLLIEELETLKDAKIIIENYKKEVQQYLTEVPDYVMEFDEDGFYSRLGFAIINESTLVVAYKFSYTSNGGKAQRSFTVPMTEDTVIKLIEMLESKLTMSAFTKEQRSLMTNKLRQEIKERDNYTCRSCGNSTHQEPNLLLEIDHIIPVAKGGCTEVNNLQTLCWKCNRSKGSKIV